MTWKSYMIKFHILSLASAIVHTALGIQAVSEYQYQNTSRISDWLVLGVFRGGPRFYTVHCGSPSRTPVNTGWNVRFLLNQDCLHHSIWCKIMHFATPKLRLCLSLVRFFSSSGSALFGVYMYLYYWPYLSANQKFKMGLFLDNSSGSVFW